MQDAVKRYSWQVYSPVGKDREVTAAQAPLTLKQEIQLARVFARTKIKSWKDLQDISVSEIVEFIGQENIAGGVLDAILIRDDSVTADDLMSVPYPVQKEIIADFFSLNQQITNDLKSMLFSKILNSLTALATPSRSRRKKSSSSARAEA